MTAKGAITTTDVHEILEFAGEVAVDDARAQEIADEVNTAAAAAMLAAATLEGRQIAERVTHAAVVAGRHVRDYLVDNGCRASHGTSSVVGYVVRETIDEGVMLTRTDVGNGLACGYDVGAFVGATSYAEAVTRAQEYRGRGRRGYAVVDWLYACGHRS